MGFVCDKRGSYHDSELRKECSDRFYWKTDAHMGRYNIPASDQCFGARFWDSFIGVLPGAGSAPAAFAAYGLEKKVLAQSG